jgi:uncharacterized protein (DUF2147 family)
MKGIVALLPVLVAVLLAVPLPARPASAAPSTPPPISPLGDWLTPGHDGVIRIAPCAVGSATLCGWLVAMDYTGAMPLNVWKQPQCRMSMMTGFVREADESRWDGMILDPDSGRRYHATIRNDGPNVLKLRGYVLMPLLGETQSWTRFTGHIGPACHLLP